MERPLLTIAFATRKDGHGSRPFVRHLLETCGLQRDRVEVLAHTENSRGLASVYNEVLRKAGGSHLVLVHDDVSFARSPGWGGKVIAELEANPRTSVLGVAGTTILQESGLWLHEQVACGHVLHRRGRDVETTRYALPHVRVLPAAALDGVFLAARTDDVRGLVLDEATFDGFHFYDLELCMQARAAGLRLGVTEAIDVVHDSTGDFGDEWERYRARFVEKYRAVLPASAFDRADRFPFREFRKEPAGASPTVAVLIPTKDRVDLVRSAVAAIRNRTAPSIRATIYVLDTGSSPASLAQLHALEGVRVLELGYYHFARIHNDVILTKRLIEEDLLLFHNNDVELVNDTLSHLLAAYATEKNPGIVGARLHFPNGLVQHAGMRVTLRGNEPVSAHHWGHSTLWNWDHEVRTGVSGCTFALALMERALYESCGGLSESYESCFEDVELNLRAILAGRRNVLAGDAVAIHHESLTRNADPAKAALLRKDFATLSRFVRANLGKLRPSLESLPPLTARERAQLAAAAHA
jgi:GT2 family glycosyltransferase